MKFSRLIFANLFRKKMRFGLTIGSFAVALFLFAYLAVIRIAFTAAADIAGADRLVVINRISIIQPLPLAYRDRMLKMKGVKDVTFDNWFGGVYKDERSGFFPQFAIDIENQRKVFPEFKVPDEQWNVFARDRQGAIVGAATAKKFGWKIGDRVPIKGTIFTGEWAFNIDGIYHVGKQGGDETQFWFHWDYLQESIPAVSVWKGKAGWYTVRVSDPDDAPRIVKAIDAEFANSPFETHTDTEKAFTTNWLKQFGNIKLLIMSIGTVVFFTLLLVTGNTMAIAVRERTSELAVLKALGYSDRFVLFFVLTESLAISALGGGAGLLLAKLCVVAFGDPTHGMLPMFYLPWNALLLGAAATLAVGIVSGLLPAISAMRLRVVDALRRV